MTRLACQYAVARFLPYAETGEFANVGIVLACPATGFLGTQLMPAKKTGRIAAFFEPLDKNVYRVALEYLRKELARVELMLRERVDTRTPAAVQQMFGSLTRPQESILRFSDTRVILTDDPAEELERIFARLVERDFADKTYQENLLDREVRTLLVRAKVRKHFEPFDIGDEFVHARFPFVHLHDGKPTAAIKPLDLAKDDPNQVFELGGHWLERVRRLGKHDLLPEVLFAVRKPASDKPIKAADEIIGELRELGVTVAASTEADAVIRFAHSVVTPEFRRSH